MKTRFLGFILVSIVSLSGTWGQDSYQSEVFVLGSDSLNYRILYPEDFQENKKYPLVLFLHGSGERGSDNQKQLVHGSSLFLNESRRQQYQPIVIFPQCPKGDYWSNAKLGMGPDGERLIYQNGGTPNMAMSLLISMMDSILALSYTANNQIYVGGLSMGGMGVFEILSRRPEMFAAAFPICGGGNTEAAKKYAKNVKLWIFHGAKDDVILPSRSTEMVIALRDAGGDVKYTLFKDANHNSWDSAFGEPDLLPWLFSIKKK